MPSNGCGKCCFGSSGLDARGLLSGGFHRFPKLGVSEGPNKKDSNVMGSVLSHAYSMKLPYAFVHRKDADIFHDIYIYVYVFPSGFRNSVMPPWRR